MAEIYDLDTSAANNNSAPPDGWPEGMSYSQVNNTGREQMAVIARYIEAIGATTTTGTVNAYLLTVTQIVTSYTVGMHFTFKADRATVAGAATLKVNSAPTVAIVNNDGTALSAAGDIANGAIVTVVYDGTNFVMATPNSNSITQVEGDIHYIRQDGTSTLAVSIPFAAGIDVTGTLNASAATTVNTLTASGAVDCDTTLNVDGNTTLNTVTASGAVDCDTTLNVDGNTTVNTLTASGAVDCDTTLNVDGVLTANIASNVVLTTAARSSGGVLVNNGVSAEGSTAERVLTFADTPKIRRLTSNFSTAANSVDVPIGSAGDSFQFALRSGVGYHFKVIGHALRIGGASEAILGLGVYYTGTNSAGYWSTANFDAGFDGEQNSIPTGLSPVVQATGNAASVGVHRRFDIHGYINTTSVGTLIFIYGSTNSVAGATLQIKSGSYAMVEVAEILN